ncbi:MAG TPA: hypothetical protein VIK29_02830, partial [Paludibacter sp.]
MTKRVLIAIIMGITTTLFLDLKAQTFPFRNEKSDVEQRIFDLVNRLTVDEKISLLRYDSPAIERLGIPAYNWWSEG